MAGEHLQARARVVVAGVDEEGRSTIVSDRFSETRLATPAFTINQTWGVKEVPTHVHADNALGVEAVIPPPPQGFYHVLATFPPDSELDYEEFASSLAAAGAAESFVEDQVPGMHETDTVDIVTILSGETYVVLEKGETLLKAGDTFIQRGTKHRWRNKSDKPCVHSTVMISARR